MINVCESCGRNVGEYPKTVCMKEPYGDEICKTKCEYWISVAEYAALRVIYNEALDKQRLAKRRKARKEARRLRWAEYKQPDNLCRTCANNLAKFPLVRCKMQPFFEEEEYQDECVNYHKITPGELIVFTKFPCGTVLESVWSYGCCRIRGYDKVNGKRPIAGSLIGTPPLNLEVLEHAYKFLEYGMHPTDRKLFMNNAVKEALGIPI